VKVNYDKQIGSVIDPLNCPS